MEENISNHLEAEKLWNKINGMSDNDKNILSLRYKNELSIKEISKLTSKSTNAIKLAISRAKKKLRSR